MRKPLTIAMVWVSGATAGQASAQPQQEPPQPPRVEQWQFIGPGQVQVIQVNPGRGGAMAYSNIVANIPTPEELDSVAIDPAVLSAVRELDDPEFAVREAATRQVAQAAADRMQLYAVLARQPLTVEQRYRVLEAVRQHLLGMPRGAVGISMQNFFRPAQGGGVGPMEIRIDEVLPGFPAEHVLIPGDRITHINGRALVAQDDLLNTVQAMRPGEFITLSIKRTRVNDDGEVMMDPVRHEVVVDELEVEVELGSAEDLRDDRERSRVRPSRVLLERQAEAAKAVEAFAPRPRVIGIPSESTLLSPHEEPPSPQQLLMRGFVDPHVEQHPDIQALLLDVSNIKNGTLRKTPELERRWWDTVNRLVAERSDPNQSLERQAYLQRVLIRYVELMQ